MSTTFIAGINLTTIECGECAGTYAIDERYRLQKQQEGKSWRCPYCHIWWGYGLGENAKLKAEIEKLKVMQTRLTADRDYHIKESEHFRKSRDTIKGIFKSAKTRIGQGVCPCCRRTFQNVARHMKTKHPTYAQKEDQ